MDWIRSFNDVGMTDVASVGGKNASLGETMLAIVEAEKAIDTAEASHVVGANR